MHHSLKQSLVFLSRGNGAQVGLCIRGLATPGRQCQSPVMDSTWSMPAPPPEKQLQAPTQTPRMPSREGNDEGKEHCFTPLLIKASQLPRLGSSEGFEWLGKRPNHGRHLERSSISRVALTMADPQAVEDLQPMRAPCAASLSRYSRVYDSRMVRSQRDIATHTASNSISYIGWLE